MKLHKFEIIQYEYCYGQCVWVFFTLSATCIYVYMYVFLMKRSLILTGIYVKSFIMKKNLMGNSTPTVT